MFLQKLFKHQLDPAEAVDLERTLSNWSYLSIWLQEREHELTLEKLEKLMLVEWSNKRRSVILRRLFTRWQKLYQQNAFGEMNV
jgi:hypothetical protein